MGRFDGDADEANAGAELTCKCNGILASGREPLPSALCMALWPMRYGLVFGAMAWPPPRVYARSTLIG
jgi:hypothetical protein